MIVITSKHGTTILFSHYNPFQGKVKEKMARKAFHDTPRYSLINDEANVVSPQYAFLAKGIFQFTIYNVTFEKSKMADVE